MAFPHGTARCWASRIRKRRELNVCRRESDRFCRLGQSLSRGLFFICLRETAALGAICVASRAQFLRCCVLYHAQNCERPKYSKWSWIQIIRCDVKCRFFVFTCSFPSFVCVSLQSGGGLPEDQWPSLCHRGCWSLRRPSAPTSAAFN